MGKKKDVQQTNDDDFKVSESKQAKISKEEQHIQISKQETEALINGDSPSPSVVSSPQAELKAKIESILFCIPEGVTIDLLAHKVNMASTDSVKWAIQELQKDCDTRGGLKIITDDKGVWKFKVPDEHIPFIQEAAEPEFDRAVLETLAYIAWRGGSRQCDVVRVRGNKAYNHIRLLKERGFVESHRSGLSKWLELTKKFNEYFNLKQGEKLPVPEEITKAAEEAEKAAAAAELQAQELKAQQALSVAELKKSKDEERFEKEEATEDEPDSGEDPKPEDGDGVPGEPEDDEEEFKSKENPDNE
ncbi:MAG: SMC-Scp complex subunit ScpB [archaeon]